MSEEEEEKEKRRLALGLTIERGLHQMNNEVFCTIWYRSRALRPIRTPRSMMLFEEKIFAFYSVFIYCVL